MMAGKGAWKSTAVYAGLLAGALAVGFAGAWIFGAPLDRSAYDFMFRHYRPQPWTPQSAILAIDEKTLSAYGGIRGIRAALERGLPILNAASPKVVVVDVILADRGADPKLDAALAEAFCATPNLVLSADSVRDGWDMPLPELQRCAAAIGHVHAAPDENDSITRAIPLEKHEGQRRLWALALEAYRLSRGAEIQEDTAAGTGLDVGGAIVPIPYEGGMFRRPGMPDTTGRLMRVRFLPRPEVMPPIPRVSLKDLIDKPVRAFEFTGKVVFVGVTAVTELHDRLTTPISPDTQTSGIEIHANAFETLARGLYLIDVRDDLEFLFCLAIAIAMGLAFRYLPGWWAYSGGLAVLAVAFVAPYLFFTHCMVFPFAAPVSVAWFSFVAAAAYYHLVVRRNWHIELASRTRYQQAMQFVTHEMRTPLSAIQGSSELISRYPLTEEKRKQVAQLIHSESKRLARMVEVFLSVERLSAGQMELKRENIEVKQMVDLCVERARPLSERKHITLNLEPIPEDLRLTGDRELMEYACYNLLTNAVKYSPRETEVTVSGYGSDGYVRIAVKDRGIGMDQKEVKQIFQKFYRTKKAEESGEAGTGIGLSIVQQIVEQHGGRIDVVSQPGVGSCFTLVMPAAITERS
jgi:signal transduction histidine kinase